MLKNKKKKKVVKKTKNKVEKKNYIPWPHYELER